jgi:hypothetical protein
MLNMASEVFCVEKVTLENIDLLPEDRKPIIYFVMSTQGGQKNIVYIGFTYCLRQKWIKHHLKVEFEFLNRVGYQIDIFGIVLPEATSNIEGQAVQALYRRVLEPKLNKDRNSFAVIQAEQIKKQIEILEENGCEHYKEQIKSSRQDRYEDLKKQIEIWEQNGDDKSTIIDKIWTACQPLP